MAFMFKFSDNSIITYYYICNIIYINRNYYYFKISAKIILCFNCLKMVYSKIYCKTFENACPMKACKIEKQHSHDFCIS